MHYSKSKKSSNDNSIQHYLQNMSNHINRLQFVDMMRTIVSILIPTYYILNKPEDHTQLTREVAKVDRWFI